MDLRLKAAQEFLCEDWDSEITISDMLESLDNDSLKGVILWQPFQDKSAEWVVEEINKLYETLLEVSMNGESEMYWKVMNIITYDDLDEDEKFKQIKELKIE